MASNYKWPLCVWPKRLLNLLFVATLDLPQACGLRGGGIMSHDNPNKAEMPNSATYCPWRPTRGGRETPKVSSIVTECGTGGKCRKLARIVERRPDPKGSKGQKYDPRTTLAWRMTQLWSSCKTSIPLQCSTSNWSFAMKKLNLCIFTLFFKVQELVKHFLALELLFLSWECSNSLAMNSFGIVEQHVHSPKLWQMIVEPQETLAKSCFFTISQDFCSFSWLKLSEQWGTKVLKDWDWEHLARIQTSVKALTTVSSPTLVMQKRALFYFWHHLQYIAHKMWKDLLISEIGLWLDNEVLHELCCVIHPIALSSNVAYAIHGLRAVIVFVAAKWSIFPIKTAQGKAVTHVKSRDVADEGPIDICRCKSHVKSCRQWSSCWVPNTCSSRKCCFQSSSFSAFSGRLQCAV